MRFKDILAIVTSQATDEHVISFAEKLAEQNSGSVTGLVVNWVPGVPAAVEGMMLSPVWGDLINIANTQLMEEEGKVRARLANQQGGAGVKAELLELGAARGAIGLRARHADVAIVGRPTGANSDSAHALLEGPLFEAGRPVIIVPPEWKLAEIGRKIMVAWKPTREAARALGDAEDLLACADDVCIVTVDARPSEDGYGAHPGADITAHLARRDMQVQLLNVDSLGRSPARAIMDQALAFGADLIVMGGYGRARLSEFIFGGMTREMLRSCTIPVLMSH